VVTDADFRAICKWRRGVAWEHEEARIRILTDELLNGALGDDIERDSEGREISRVETPERLNLYVRLKEPPSVEAPLPWWRRALNRVKGNRNA